MKIPLPNVDYQLRLPKGYLSVSQIECFLSCPRAYEFRYVLGRKAKSNAAQFEGLALAAALESIGKIKMKKQEPTISKALKVHGAYVRKHADSVGDWNGTTPKNIKLRAEHFLESFWREGHVESLNPEGVEVSFNTTIAGVPFTGIADVVEPNYIFDYKVTKSTRYYNPERSFQLSAYAHVFQKSRVGYVCFLKEGKKPIEVMPAQRDLEKTKMWVEFTIATVARAISLGCFSPCDISKNFLCHEKYCDHFKECYGQCQ